MVMLTIGTGIGGGLVLGGKLYRGSTGAGAELGHVVIERTAPAARGPARTAAASRRSPRAPPSAARAAPPPSGSPTRRSAGSSPPARRSTGSAVTEAAIAGDEVAIEVVALIGSHLGVALSSTSPTSSIPDVIVIGGGASAAGDLLLDPAREELRTRALPPMNDVAVVPATLGPDAGMIGAAAMAIGRARSRRA